MHLHRIINGVQGRPERVESVRVSSRNESKHAVVARRRLLGCTCGCCYMLASPGCFGSTPSEDWVRSDLRPRTGLRDQLFADAMAHGMKEYEQALRPVKVNLFSTLGEHLESLSLHENNRKPSIAEVGIGTGPNLEFYDLQNTFLTAIEPNDFMKPYLEKHLQKLGFPLESVHYENGFAEHLPLDSKSQDAVVCTLLLCSVSNVSASLGEFHRVLKNNGKLLLIEHVRAGPEEGLLRLGQTLLNPLQRLLADGCNLNRDTLESISRSGMFSTEAIQQFSVPGLGVLSPHIAGVLTKIG